MHSLLKNDAPDVHYPDPHCTSAIGTVYDFTLRVFSNGTRHVKRFCKCCGKRATEAVKRESIPLWKCQELRMTSGRISEVTHG